MRLIRGAQPSFTSTIVMLQFGTWNLKKLESGASSQWQSRTLMTASCEARSTSPLYFFAAAAGRRNRPARYIFEALAAFAGHLHRLGRAVPAAEKLGPFFRDFGREAALPVAVVDFREGRNFRKFSELALRGGELRGFLRAVERACEHRLEFVAREPFAECRRLREPLFVQRRVLLSLKAPLDVPRRLAVAYYEKSHALNPPL